MLNLITPDWPAPTWIKAVTTTRHGGFSKPPFDSLNLGLEVGDHPDCVIQNRALLKSALELRHDPLWLKQVHGTKAITANSAWLDRVADAIYTQEPHVVCAVQTADCLPLLVCSRTRYCVAAIHAGWKGLAAGIIENSIRELNCAADDLLVWLGPAIGPQAFIVGSEVVKIFADQDHSARTAFLQIGDDHWQADLYQLAKQRLSTLGIEAVYGARCCTYADKEKFFSFRRDKVTGRMASLIWINQA